MSPKKIQPFYKWRIELASKYTRVFVSFSRDTNRIHAVLKVDLFGCLV